MHLLFLCLRGLVYKALCGGGERCKFQVITEIELHLWDPEDGFREAFTDGMTYKQGLKAVGICQLDKVKNIPAEGM